MNDPFHEGLAAQPLNPSPARQHAHDAPDEQRIDFNAPCAQCLYDLKGLTREDRCPECGRPVADSLLPFILHNADPAYTRPLRAAARWIFFLLPVSTVLVVAAWFIDQWLIAPNRAPFMLLTLAASHLAAGLAWAHLAAPHHARPQLEDIERSRRRLRTIAIVSLPVIFLAAATAAIPPLSATLSTLAMIAWCVVVVLRCFAAYRYSAALARIAVAPTLIARARRAHTVLVLLASVVAVFFLAALLTKVASPPPGAQPNAFFVVVAMVAGLTWCAAAPTASVTALIHFILHCALVECLRATLTAAHHNASRRHQRAASTTPPA